MHSVPLTQTTQSGLYWSCCKSCVCVAGRDVTWGVTTPADQHWCGLLRPVLPWASGCTVSRTLRLIPRGKRRGLHRAHSACSQLYAWLPPSSAPQHQHVLLLTVQSRDPALLWCITTRAPIPFKTWEFYSYLLMSVTWSCLTAREIKKYIFY